MICLQQSLERTFLKKGSGNWNKVNKNRQILLAPLPSLLSDSSMASNLPPEHYYSEANRLETFRRWTKKNPKPSDLASAGLFYEGNRDYVKCAFCEGVIGCWDDTVNLPLIEHQTLYPTCPFVLGMNYSSQNSLKNHSKKSQKDLIFSFFYSLLLNPNWHELWRGDFFIMLNELSRVSN